MKYLMIFEDGECYKGDEVTQSEISAIESGILEVIRIADQKTLYEGKWHDLRVWGE